MMKNIWSQITTNSVRLAWIVALAAMLGSLYFGEILNNTPCYLCWYQRIAMYPIVVILALGIVFKDRHAAIYSLALSLVGAAIAAYHNLLYYGVFKEDFATCKFGVSCTTRDLDIFGWIGFPLLSLIAFIVIGLLSWIALGGSNLRKKS